MATKLARKTLPSGTSASDFTYAGRPANDQGDFGPDVGIADMACVNQFGEANNSKYYHAGVVRAGGRWYVYLEWGRVGAGRSWDPSFGGGDFQFVECSDEGDAREFFRKQCGEKNTKRLTRTTVAGKTLWCAAAGKDGYLVQRLATRSRGLPDAYTIKDSTGVAPRVEVVAKAATVTAGPQAQPQVVSLAKSLVGGTQDYARAASAATGIVPTQGAIDEVRKECIPAALSLLSTLGSDPAVLLASTGLKDLSKYVATIVPRPIPRGGDPMSILLTGETVAAVQLDLDAFEAALGTETFVPVPSTPGYDPKAALNADLRWIDPTSTEGVWLEATYQGMSHNRHAHLSGRKFQILNMFAVSRPDRDALFLQTARQIAAKRKGQIRGDVMPELQPSHRPDLADVADIAGDAGIFLGVHGTRSVNVGPILRTNFRLPAALKGVPIAGSAFGAGTYFADSRDKSHGYVSDSGSLYSGSSNGGIAGRGFFMFLCDVAGGKFHYPRSTMWGETSIPGDADSIYAHPKYVRSLANNEYVIMNPAGQQRIRYIVEARLK